jgi:predicted small lipoprotein YifL
MTEGAHVCRTIVVVVALVAAVITGCGNKAGPSDSPDADAGAPQQASSKPAGGGEPLHDAFIAANKSAAWFGAIDQVKLDDRAVIVRTTLGEGDEATARKVCEAAYVTASASKVVFQSVAVRTADDATLAHRSKLSGDVACK